MKNKLGWILSVVISLIILLVVIAFRSSKLFVNEGWKVREMKFSKNDLQFYFDINETIKKADIAEIN